MSVVGYVGRRISDDTMSDVGYSDVGCCMSDIRKSDVVCRIFERRMLYVGYSNVGCRTSVDRYFRFWHQKKWPPKKKMAAKTWVKKRSNNLFVFRICRTLDVGRRICRTSDVGRCDVTRWMPDVGCRSSDMSDVGCRTLRCRTSDIRTSDVGCQ